MAAQKMNWGRYGQLGGPPIAAVTAHGILATIQLDEGQTNNFPRSINRIQLTFSGGASTVLDVGSLYMYTSSREGVCMGASTFACGYAVKAEKGASARRKDGSESP